MNFNSGLLAAGFGMKCRRDLHGSDGLEAGAFYSDECYPCRLREMSGFNRRRPAAMSLVRFIGDIPA